MDDINSYNEKGRTKLMEAADSGDLAMVTWLLNKDADPFMTDENYGTTTAKMYAGRKAYDDNIYSKIENILADITGEEVEKKQKQKETVSCSYEHSDRIYSHTDTGELKALIIIMVGITTLTWLFVGNPLNLFSSEITIYKVACNDRETIKDNRFKCRNKYTKLSKATFKAMEEKQEVIYWNTDNETELTKLEKCTVRDSENWSCITPNFRSIKMVNGKYYGYSKYQIIVGIPRWEWILFNR